MTKEKVIVLSEISREQERVAQLRGASIQFPEARGMMANRVLLTVPNERLRKVSRPVTDPRDVYVRELAEYMFSQLESLHALGLAAPQFGELSCLIVVKLQGIELVLVNPEITKRKGEHLVTEGCTSIPGRAFVVKRPKIVKVRGYDLDGKVHSVKGHDLLAQVLCHEVDHLGGVLIDKIGKCSQQPYATF